MGQNSLKTCLSGTVKQDGQRFPADIFSKVLQIHCKNSLLAGSGTVKPADPPVKH
jgi:hypothetical protein